MSLLPALLHEINVCIHLFGKLGDHDLEYRLSPSQRSTDELLRYIATCAIAPIVSMRAGDWKLYDEAEERIAARPMTDFVALMEEQAEALRQVFAEMTDEELDTKIVKAPGVRDMLTLREAVMRTSYAWLVAYRMQFFLHLKASGITDIGTSNNWAGVDRRRE